MNKEDLLTRLDELNCMETFRKNMVDEYRLLLKELEKLGVPPLSATIQNEEDRDTPISSFASTFIPSVLVSKLNTNGIMTVGQLIDLNRIETMDFKGFGPGKWLQLYSIQKKLLQYIPNNPKVEKKGSVTLKEIEKYGKDELIEINNKLFTYEEESLCGVIKNKGRYQALLAELNNRGQKRSLIFEDEEMNDVTLEVIESSRIRNNCERLGIQRLSQILDITENDIFRIPHVGKKAWKEIVYLKKEIVESPQHFLDDYKNYYAIRELPDVETTVPLYKKILTALEQLAEILDIRRKDRDAFVIKEAFVNGCCLNEIVRNIYKVGGSSVTRERVRQIIEIVRAKIMSGSQNPLIDNAYFSDSLISEIESFAENILYCPLSYVNTKLQAPDDFDPRPIISLLGLDVFECTKERITYVDKPYVISGTDTNSDVQVHFKALDKVMANLALPVSKDVIFSEILKSDTMTVECNMDLLEHILSHSMWIEHDNNGNYSYIYTQLKTAEAKAARIVYLKKNVTSTDIKILDKALGGASYKGDLNTTQKKTRAKYPWVAKGAKNDEWVYNPIQASTLPSIREAIEKYAQKHIIFKFSDMVQHLKSKGYDKYADGSFRAYVLKCCVPSNTDTDLLCLESEATNNNPSKWRNRSISGTTNWIINSCVKLLGNRKLKISELNKLVFAQPEAKDYNIRHIYNISIYNYCCSENEYTKEKLFVINDSGYIWVNQACIEEQLVDLETIGSPNKQPEYFMDVVSEIVTQLKKADNHRLTLAKLRTICHPIIAPHANNTIFYKIIKKLPEEVERIDENGVSFLQLKPEKLTYEKSYSMPQLSINTEKEKNETPQMVETIKPFIPNQREKIDWSVMAINLKNELGYYNRWWDINSKLTLNPAIEGFVHFLQSTDDVNLHDHVSRHIYEFLTLKLDRYDLHDHLTVITANLESLIRKVYMLNNHSQAVPLTSGLADCTALIPELQDWLKFADGSQTFAKIYSQFKRCRNLILHGVDVQMNTVNKYQSIYSFIALYVYIYTRFTK